MEDKDQQSHKTLMINHLYENIKIHTLVYNYYCNIVYQLQIYFKSANNFEFKNKKIKRPVHIYSPIVFASIMSIMIIFYLLIEGFNYKLFKFTIAVEFLPLYGRIYFLFVFLAWSFLISSYQIFALKEDLLYYTVLAVFVFKSCPDSKITPENLSKSLLLIILIKIKI